MASVNKRPPDRPRTLVRIATRPQNNADVSSRKYLDVVRVQFIVHNCPVVGHDGAKHRPLSRSRPTFHSCGASTNRQRPSHSQRPRFHKPWSRFDLTPHFSGRRDAGALASILVPALPLQLDPKISSDPRGSCVPVRVSTLITKPCRRISKELTRTKLVRTVTSINGPFPRPWVPFGRSPSDHVPLQSIIYGECPGVRALCGSKSPGLCGGRFWMEGRSVGSSMDVL